MQAPGIDVDLDLLAFGNARDSAFKYRQAVVDGIAKKLAPETRSDDRCHAHAAQDMHSLFARRVDAEILARDDDAAASETLGKARCDRLECLGCNEVQILAGQVFPGAIQIGIDIVAEQKGRSRKNSKCISHVLPPIAHPAQSLGR